VNKPTPTIAEQAISRALQYLKAVPGVLYRVEYEGIVLADNFPPPAAAPKRVRKILHNFARDIGYVTALKNLKSGGSVTYTRSDYPLLAEDRTWASFVSSFKSTASKYFNSEDFLWEVSSEKLTLLYIAGDF
jgi:hypothetical protein